MSQFPIQTEKHKTIKNTIIFSSKGLMSRSLKKLVTTKNYGPFPVHKEANHTKIRLKPQKEQLMAQSPWKP
jgi:hypothetical protein